MAKFDKIWGAYHSLVRYGAKFGKILGAKFDESWVATLVAILRHLSGLEF